MVSWLGEDGLSFFLMDFLEAEKVETHHVQTAPGFLPSLCLTEVSPPDRFPQYGNAAAAIVVSRLSCSEAMPLLSELEEMMRQQRKG
jgi:sugar/nucleoside kinase (ribokinase family)